MSFWDGRQVLVTGTTGLLGGWLTEALLDAGAEVTTLVRDWVPLSRAVTAGILDRCNVVRGDLEDLAVVTRAINEYEVDSVFHLGAQAIVGTAVRSPLSTFESNIRGTWTLLEAIRLCPRRVERVIVASSDKAYGDHETLPYTESMALQGRFPYDVSKSCSDLIALSYWHTWQLPLAVTRCGNLFGGGDLNYNRLVPGTIRSVLAGERPVIRSDGQYRARLCLRAGCGGGLPAPRRATPWRWRDRRGLQLRSRSAAVGARGGRSDPDGDGAERSPARDPQRGATRDPATVPRCEQGA